MSMSRTPGIHSGPSSTPKIVGSKIDFLDIGGVLDGALSRDWSNTNEQRTILAGCLLGLITTGGKFMPWILGVSQANKSSSDTDVAVTVAQATQMAAVLTLPIDITFVGPPTATGVVALDPALELTAIATGTGVLTHDALTADLAAGSVVALDNGADLGPVSFVSDEHGLDVYDVRTGETNQDASLQLAVYAKLLYTDMITGYNDLNASMKAYVKSQLRLAMAGVAFDDDFGM